MAVVRHAQPPIVQPPYKAIESGPVFDRWRTVAEAISLHDEPERGLTAEIQKAALRTIFCGIGKRIAREFGQRVFDHWADVVTDLAVEASWHKTLGLFMEKSLELLSKFRNEDERVCALQIVRPLAKSRLSDLVVDALGCLADDLGNKSESARLTRLLSFRGDVDAGGFELLAAFMATD